VSAIERSSALPADASTPVRRRHRKAGRRHFYGIFARWQSTYREVAIFAGLDFANGVARLALQSDCRIGDGLARLIDDRAADNYVSIAGLRKQ
jgi:hypothetical protein